MTRAYMTIGSVRSGVVTVRAQGFLGPAPAADAAGAAGTRREADAAPGRTPASRRQTPRGPTERGAGEE